MTKLLVFENKDGKVYKIVNKPTKEVYDKSNLRKEDNIKG